MPRRVVPRITPEGERVEAHAAEVIARRAAALELLKAKFKYLGVALSFMALFKAAPVNWVFLITAYIGDWFGNREMRLFTNKTKKWVLWRMLTFIFWVYVCAASKIFNGANSKTPMFPLYFRAAFLTTFAGFAYIMCVRAKRNVVRAIREEGPGVEPNSDSDSDSDSD
ncbi:hypothetical protein CAEBREN_31354 [Caenorhabditis brenneri]|uniref:Uncharacterized protein n=1 Tax=Caenorhabditis brenneri TaxID=135651 RepID=G0MFZ5_CAEBE|nr:hypothetical protein CAEBREN_31354 [Caenorhabditis brenneri]